MANKNPKTKLLKKEVDKAKKENGKSNKKDLRTIGILVMIFAALFAVVLFYKFNDGTVAREGSKVEVRYIGSFENGSVFDTTMKEVAEEAGIYNPKRGYSNLKFTVGKGQMISGFDEAVKGMQVGESKIVTILPKKAYGDYKPNATMTVPILKELPLYETVTRDIIIHPEDLVSVFNVSTLKINDTLPATAKFKWPIKIIDISDRDLTGRLLVELNDYYEEGSFNYTITQIMDTEMILKRNIMYKRLPSKFGELLIEEQKNKIITKYNISVGQKVVLDNVGYYIIGEDNESILLDQNHPMAGKTLIFNITLDGIVG